MKKLLILIAFLAGVVGVAAVVGAILPRDHVAAMSVTVAAPPVRVWTTITDVNAYPSWRPGLKSVEVVSPSPLSWKEVSGSGSMTLVVDEMQAPSRMVARIVDEGEPFGGDWEYVVVADSTDPNKARVTITERGWVSNPVFRFVAKFVMGHDSTIDEYLRALSRKFGTEAEPAAVAVKDS
jgi:uncharacterized protein YndB with AHSA1/START domain